MLMSSGPGAATTARVARPLAAAVLRLGADLPGRCGSDGGVQAG